jgi:integrase
MGRGSGGLTGLRMRVELKHIRHERDGRIYVRLHGRSIRLREPPGTEAFLEEYRRAIRLLAGPHPAAGHKAVQGSLSWLCRQYFASAEFKELAFSSQAVRRRTLERICERDGNKPYARMESRHVRTLRDEKPGPESANGVLKALRGLFAWAVTAEFASVNPAKNVAKVRYKTDGFHTWTIEEVRQFETRHAPGTKPRLALALLLYTGARRGDVVLLGRQMVRDGWLTFKSSKTGVVVSIPVVPELKAELDRAEKANMTFLVTAYGKPFTAAGFGMRFREWSDQAGLKHCSAHGLRKAGATIAAERGASEAQLNAIFGWAENSNESRRYTRAARQKVLAASATTLLSTTEAGTETVPSAETGTQKAKKISNNNG